MWILAPLMSIALAAGTADTPKAPIVKTSQRYRLKIPGNVKRPVVRADAMAGEIVLKASGGLKTWAKSLKRKIPKTICPKMIKNKKSIILKCKTRQIASKVTRKGKSRYFDMLKLRGIPFTKDDSAVPYVFYDPMRLDIGGPCPGDNSISRGECAFRVGKYKKSKRYFRRALNGLDREMAALRLGDLALREGKHLEAAGWYKRVGKTGPYARLAAARLCELQGTCFDPLRPGNRYDPLEPVALPEPLYTEVLLRRARAHTLADKPIEGARILVESSEDSEHDRPCDYALVLCQRIAMEALKTPGADAAAQGLSLYSVLPLSKNKKKNYKFATLAAQRAADLGAPQYAGNILAAVTGNVSQEDLPAHLALTAELYLDGGDTARAFVVLRYVKTRFRNQINGAPWANLFRRLKAQRMGQKKEPMSTNPAIQAELKRANSLVARIAKEKENAGKAQEEGSQQ
jgi:hypothetical protein